MLLLLMLSLRVLLLPAGLRWCPRAGIVFAMGTFNLMHCSMHGAITTRQPLKSILDLSFTVLSGGCCPIWVARHNICHHGHTNTVWKAHHLFASFPCLHSL